TASASIWQCGNGLIYSMKNAALILSISKVFNFLGIIMIAPGIYFFTITSLGLFEQKKRYILANYAIALVFYILGLLTDWLVASVEGHFYGYEIVFGPLAIPFLLFFSVLIIRSLQLDRRAIRQMEPGIKRDQIKLFMISLSIAALASVDFLSSIPSLHFYPIGFLPVLIFISLQAYAIIKYKRASLGTIFEAIEDGIIVIDKNDKIEEVNPSMETMLGIKRHDLLGKDFLSIFSLVSSGKEDPEKAEATIKYLLLTPTKVADEDIAFKEPEQQLNVVSSPILDRFGVRKGNVLIFRDITERKKMEEELRKYKESLEELVAARTEQLKKSEGKYKALVDHALVGIGIHQNTQMVFVNRQFASMLRFSEEEMIGLPISQLIHPDERELIMSRAYDRYSGKEVIETYEMRMVRKDGSFMPAFISNTAIEYNGARATLITVVDTTETKLRKELEQVNEELERFTYSISHDLRAPLRSIDGFSLALQEDYEDRLDREGQDYLQRIRAACQRMAAMIDAILQLSRIGRYEMHREKVNLSALAQDIALELEATSPDHKVEFSITEGIVAAGDPMLLRMALENLIGNAWKFTKERECARIEFGVMQQNFKTIYYVRDNGTGFDMKYVDKIFDPFQRLDNAKAFSGTGIGLASVKRIVHRHGGEIWAESAFDKGATFYFTLE
ncbi:MAG TPA: PAS domain S-box protein, partial [Rectinema sp.]|nr:PAS domain S-box protein [Rectinema sp.]